MLPHGVVLCSVGLHIETPVIVVAAGKPVMTVGVSPHIITFVVADRQSCSTRSDAASDF